MQIYNTNTEISKLMKTILDIINSILLYIFTLGTVEKSEYHIIYDTKYLPWNNDKEVRKRRSCGK